MYVDPDIKSTVRVFPMQERGGYYRYDMNENPEGLPKAFVDSVLREITPEFLATYPEPDRFTSKYAGFIGVSPENIVATNGSDTAIRYIFQAFGEKGKDVVTVAPSFEMYWVNCKILGFRHVPVPYNDDMTIDIERIVDAITDDTRIVVLLNPNNPVGNVYSEDELARVIAKAKEKNAVVLIDEAYHYFYPNTFLDHIKTDGNVIVLRTFSKLFSLAAVRLGVAISTPEIIGYIKNAKLTFDVNSIALLFGERILDHPELVRKLIDDEKAGRDYTLSVLEEKGYEVRNCRGNFIFVKPKHDAHEVEKTLKETYRILVHAYGNDLLKPYLRISTGSVPAMQIFLDAFLKADS